MNNPRELSACFSHSLDIGRGSVYHTAPGLR
jgi:hypothetical protein